MGTFLDKVFPIVCKIFDMFDKKWSFSVEYVILDLILSTLILYIFELFWKKILKKHKA